MGYSLDLLDTPSGAVIVQADLLSSLKTMLIKYGFSKDNYTSNKIKKKSDNIFKTCLCAHAHIRQSPNICRIWCVGSIATSLKQGEREVHFLCTVTLIRPTKKEDTGPLQGKGIYTRKASM
ncbi:hypothetical protein XENTR_v10006600 [Xenopus tropicalis]|nr:hypothetical protein XENTR_v10006600 [Xenopus tropicalis]